MLVHRKSAGSSAAPAGSVAVADEVYAAIVPPREQKPSTPSVAVVVVVDVLFFRHQFWERLIVNVGIVLVFAAFGLRFLKRP